MNNLSIHNVTEIEFNEVEEVKDTMWRTLIIHHDGTSTKITLFPKNCPAEVHLPQDDAEYDLGRLKEKIQGILHEVI